MAEFKLYDMSAQECGKITLADSVFKAEYNEPLIHSVVKATLNNARQGTKSTLTRSEVTGGKKKPHRQKKTGNARQGSTVGPHQIGGGVAFAPKPRDFSVKVNKEAKRSALRSALSEKAREDKLVFVDEIKITKIQTKKIAEMLKAFGTEKALIVIGKSDEKIRKAAKNIPYVETCTAKLVNVYDIVRFEKVLMTESAAKLIEEAQK